MKTFGTKDEAIEWMEAYVDDPCIDNIRFAFEDDAEGMAEYAERERTGCCGSFDTDTEVGGRPARIGCNYGH